MRPTRHVNKGYRYRDGGAVRGDDEEKGARGLVPRWLRPVWDAIPDKMPPGFYDKAREELQKEIDREDKDPELRRRRYITNPGHGG